MRLKCIKTFKDLKAGVWRKPGDEWEADEGRLAELVDTPWGDYAEEVVRKPEHKPEKRVRPPKKGE